MTMSEKTSGLKSLNPGRGPGDEVFSHQKLRNVATSFGMETHTHTHTHTQRERERERERDREREREGGDRRLTIP